MAAYLSAFRASNDIERTWSHNEQMQDAAAWLGELPDELAAHRRLLQRLLDWCEGDQDVRWLTVGCSLERGNADRLSIKTFSSARNWQICTEQQASGPPPL